jgi:hypothetical protein
MNFILSFFYKPEKENIEPEKMYIIADKNTINQVLINSASFGNVDAIEKLIELGARISNTPSFDYSEISTILTKSFSFSHK